MQLGNGFADQAVLFRCFEGRIIRRAELGGGGGKLSVAEAATARGVPDATVECLAFCRGNAPLLSGGGDQHLPRARSDLTKFFPEAADAGASVCSLHIELLRIPIFRIHRSRGHLDGFPVGLEFFRQNHGLPSVRLLPHLRSGQDEGHFVVRADAHPESEFRLFRLRSAE